MFDALDVIEYAGTVQEKRREALSKYFLDLSKIAFAVGVLTPFLAPGTLDFLKVLLALLVGVSLGIIGYHFQPKE